MAGLRQLERQRLSHVHAPGTEVVRKRLREYMGVLDLSAEQMADRIGRGRSTLTLFLYGDYEKHTGHSDEWTRRAIWDYLERHPIAPPRAKVRGRLFHTENYRRIRRYFLAAIERGEVCLLYGPPGTQKTFVLEHLIAERHRGGSNGALYVYASDSMRPIAMLKRIARAAGLYSNLANVERLLSSLFHYFNQVERPPAIVIDEAQHLDVHCIEVLRELNDLGGCGLVLAGSHNLLENFLRGRSKLEQWLSRIDHKDPLPGLLEDEVAEIAARELGNGQPLKLTDGRLKKIVGACRVDDIFARDAAGKPCTKKYLSVRRLVKFLGQVKEKEAAA